MVRSLSNPDGQKLAAKKCVPCEGRARALKPDRARAGLKSLDGWELTDDSKRIRKQWTVKDFLSGLAFFQQVAQIAEAEGHHPDLHLESYRNVSIELWTHAIGGLSENDFILAAKIDEVKVEEG